MEDVKIEAKAETARERQMRMMFVDKLRVNVKSLAAESLVIRREVKRACCESRYIRQQFSGESKELSESLLYCYLRVNSLANHRKGPVRQEARLAQLALAFVRGVPYRSVEAKTDNPVNPGEILNKLKRIGTLYWLGCLGDADGFKKIRQWMGSSE